MAQSAVTVTVNDYWHDSKRIHVVGTFAIGASPGTYVTSGLVTSFLTKVPNASKGPIYLRAQGVAGYLYGWTLATDITLGALRIFRSAGFTPAGTNSVPAFTVKNGTIGSNMTIGLTADAVTASLVGGTGITADRSLSTNNPVGAPTFTGTAVAAAAGVELTNALAMPAGVSGDTVDFYAIFRS